MYNFNLTSENQFASPGEAAVFYNRLNWDSLVLPERKKAPKGKWGDLPRLPDEELVRKFGATNNIGIALGERSGGLVDLDFDWPEAARIAEIVFADLPSFGRATSLHSHRFARCKLPKNRQFKIPPGAAHLFSSERSVVMELRGDGLQTMVPPSVHPSGEIVRWHDDPRGVLDVDAENLERRAGVTSALAVVLAKYPAVPGNRDNICLALTGALVRAGFNDDEIDRWVEHIATLAGDEEACKRGSKAIVARARLEADEDVWGVPALCEHLGIEPMTDTLRSWLGLHGDGEGDGGNAITIRPGFLSQIVDAAEQVLLREGVAIFQRFDSLVHVVRLNADVAEDGVGRDGGALVIKPVVPIWLRDQLGRVARWQKSTLKGMKRDDPPYEVAATYLARIGKWKLPTLKGISQSPTLRADGSILQIRGYDKASGLYYDPGNIVFPEVAEAPSREDALKALALLFRPFRGFCFATGADRSVLLATILTALVRGMFPTAPIFLFDAPVAGNGKSLLTETIGIIVAGHKPAMMSQARSEEENEKRLSSVLMAGDPLIVIDNCSYPIEGDFLCSMLTQEFVQPRILGKSETRLLSTRCVVIATGNRLVVAGDVTRRAFMCVLDAGVEHPEQREFDFDPRDEARAQRPELVAAGLTILRAYLAEGKPNPMPKLGSFESWNLIREALVWLGCADPVDTRVRIVADDPKKEVLRDVLRLWQAALGDRWITLRELEKRADEEEKGPFRDLVAELGSNTPRGNFNAKSVGRFLAKHLDGVVGGLILRAEADSSGIKRYRVVETGQPGKPGTGNRQDASPF